MAVLVTDNGFAPDDWNDGYIPLSAVSDVGDEHSALGVELRTPDLSEREWTRLVRVMPRVKMFRIYVRNFGDMEAYGLAGSLRAKGYTGRLRAHGAMLARCYTLARRAGFTEVELAPVQARLQPRDLWRIEPDWRPDGPLWSQVPAQTSRS